MCFLIVIAGSIKAADDDSGPRVWKDKTGKYRIEATLEKVGDNKVTLWRRDNGAAIEVPLSILSEPDLEYLRRRFPSLFEAPREKLLTAAALEAAAQKRRFASESVLLYFEFLADKDVPEAEKAKARMAEDRWLTDASVKKIRAGKTWYTPAEYADLVKDEDKLLESAEEFLKTSDLKSVVKRLKQASTLNPGSIRADFRLGVLAALHPEGRSSTEAEDYFTACVRRLSDFELDLTDADRANLAACYNNLALTCLRQRKIGDALRNWERCLSASPPGDPVLHNLGYLQDLVRKSGGAGLTATERQGLDRLCGSARGISTAYDRTRGWRYMRLAKSVEATTVPSAETSTSSGSPADNLVLIGGGSGFVVGANLVATNRHVVEDGIRFAIRRDGEERTAAVPTRIVTVSTDPKLDLALLRCDQPIAAPLAINIDDLKLSSEIRTLGFPQSDVLGTNIKVTSGIITSLPPLRGLKEREFEDYVMHDAVINPGCSGGPLCDRHGLIVGINTAHFPKFNYSLSAAARPIRDFLKPHVPDLLVKSPAPGVTKTWEEVVENVRASTVQVLVYAEPDQFSPRLGTAQTVKWDSYDDPWCMACYGRSAVNCPDRGCAGGGVRSFRTDAVTFPDGSVHVKKIPIRVPCRTCGGKGQVDCRACVSGIDPRFREANR
jgi:hypothetical protein